MDLESRARTIQTYVESVESLSEYYEKMGPRVEDIDRAIALWGDRLPVVVEIGCGTGRDAQEILKRTPYYVGFDVSSGMVERARATVFGGVVLQNDLRYAFARDTKTINGEVIPDRVDIIFAFASLLHSDEEEIEGVLQDALQVLTTGGIFYISLKAGEGKIIKEDEYGTRTFYLYRSTDIERLAGEAYETVYVDTQERENTDWFTIALKKR